MCDSSLELALQDGSNEVLCRNTENMIIMFVLS